MDWRDTKEQAGFRQDVRNFIREQFPEDYRPDLGAEQSMEPEDVLGYAWVLDRRSPDPKRREGAEAWARALARRGWIAPHWPRDYGGAGLTAIELFILQEEMMRAGVPTVNGIAVFLLGPTLLEHGTEEQRLQHLPGIASGEVTWAQGFSEPNAGSDLAGLETRAVRDGDSYVVNGQKTWISQAQVADWLFILARTDPGARKHRGITFLLTKADTPGITIRPIEDMRGDYPFAEVFFEDVRVPVTQRVGEENRGFYIAMATLEHERSGIGSTIKYEQMLGRLIDLLKSEERRPFVRHDWRGCLRHELAQRYIEIRALFNLARRTVSKQAAGERPGHEASMNQVFGAEVHQRLARTLVRAIGWYGNLWQRKGAPLDGLITHDSVDAIAHSFLGGTSEIQRSVIATRGLGLPRG